MLPHLCIIRQLCQQEMKQVVDTLLLEALSQCLRALRTADGDPDGIDTVRLLTKTSLRMGTLAKKRAHELASYKADRSGPFQSLVSQLPSMQASLQTLHENLKHKPYMQRTMQTLHETLNPKPSKVCFTFKSNRRRPS